MPDQYAFPPGGGYGGGLTKREWFAGMALQGMLARADFQLFPYDGAEIATVLASKNAFAIADAMIAEVAKEN